MSTKEATPLPIVGYTDKLSVRPGKTLSFMVSSKFPNYNVEIVRLIHGDPNPSGPGFKSEHIDSTVEGTYKGREQTFHHGSFIVVKNKPALKKLSSFTLQCWIYPTAPGRGASTIVAQWPAKKGGGPGFGLSLDAYGMLTLSVRDLEGKTAELKGGKPLKPFIWYFVAASFDAKSSKGTLVQQVVASCQLSDLDSSAHGTLALGDVGENKNSSDLMIAARIGEDGTREASFNGKIDGVKLFSKAFTAKELDDLKRTPSARGRYARYLVGEWDFGADAYSTRIKDRSRNHLDGLAVNLPVRAVTGHNWSGDVGDFRLVPEEYNAIHFHDDDQGGAGWKADFKFKVPEGLRSGIYAAHLQAEGSEDYVPFFVIPQKGGTKSKIAFLAPTLSYMAYSNERTMETSGARGFMGIPGTIYPSQQQDAYIVANKLTSLYDHHTDGSGVCYVSRLRPILNMRPKYNMPAIAVGKGAPHQFNADLHLVDWMETKGFKFDVVTDEDLHHEGKSVIEAYSVIVTGSHPEYWTTKMLEEMQSYLNQGGRLMYLGGNGFYWVTTVNPEQQEVFEVRRWGGTGTWKAEPGEFHNSSTGELGGIWTNRGWAPQKMLGVGFTAQGFDVNRPYKRAPSSFDERVSFVFEGVGRDELIGDFPSLVQTSGAAGFELDRLDYALGTPEHALLLATATGFSDSYQHVIEENTQSNGKQGGTVNDRVRADIVYVKYPNGGGVFSVGSIAWCGSLSYNRYENSVSRVTQNVLARFESSEPLP